MSKVIVFTPEILVEFDKEIKKAKQENKKEFTFMGQDVDTGYAEYVSQYAAQKFQEINNCRN